MISSENQLKPNFKLIVFDRNQATLFCSIFVDRIDAIIFNIQLNKHHLFSTFSKWSIESSKLIYNETYLKAF